MPFYSKSCPFVCPFAWLKCPFAWKIYPFANERSYDKVAVSSHVPQAFQTQRKKKLLGKYVEAKKSKKNAKFQIDYKYAEYYLEIEGIPHYAAD